MKRVTMKRITSGVAGLLLAMSARCEAPVVETMHFDDFRGLDTSAVNVQWNVSGHVGTPILTATLVLGGGLKTLGQVASSDVLPLFDTVRPGAVIVVY